MIRITLLVLFCLGNLVSNVQARSDYRLDDAAVEHAFHMSEDVTLNMLAMAENPFIPSADNDLDKQTIAAIVAFAGCFVGIGILIPFHRMILGCDGKEAKVVILYCVTLGGLGLLPFVDGIFLLLDDSEKQYIENPNFLMWAENL